MSLVAIYNSTGKGVQTIKVKVDISSVVLTCQSLSFSSYATINFLIS